MCFFGGGDPPPPPPAVKLPPSNPLPMREDETRRQAVLSTLYAARQGMGRSATMLTGGAGTTDYASAPGGFISG